MKRTSKRTIEEQKEAMGEALRVAAAEMEAKGYGTQVVVRVNKDQSIDGEVRIVTRRGVSTRKTLFDLGKAVPVLPTATWVSTGIVYMPRGNEPVYIRFQGKSRAMSFPQRGNKVAENIKTARDKIDRAMTRKKRRKAEQVIFRLHWNPFGKKPTREKGRKRYVEKKRRRRLKK